MEMDVNGYAGGEWGRASAFGGVEVDAETAVKNVQGRYQQLTAWAAQIVPVAHVIPCSVLDAYNRAVKEYLINGQSVFDALAAKGMMIAQVVYANGAPVMDPNDPTKYKTRTLQGPLRPPVFVASSFTRCPGLFNAEGAAMAGAGWLPRPRMSRWRPRASLGMSMSTNLGVLPLIIGGLVVLGITGGVVLALKEIKLIIHGENPRPADTVGAYISCFERLKAGGQSAEAAAQGCQNAAATGQGASSSWLVWAVAGGALLGLAYLFFTHKAQQAATSRALEPVAA